MTFFSFRFCPYLCFTHPHVHAVRGISILLLQGVKIYRIYSLCNFNYKKKLMETSGTLMKLRSQLCSNIFLVQGASDFPIAQGRFVVDLGPFNMQLCFFPTLVSYLPHRGCYFMLNIYAVASFTQDVTLIPNMQALLEKIYILYNIKCLYFVWFRFSHKC